MVERHLFAKLRAEHATPAGRAEVRRQARTLSAVAGVLGVRSAEPADAAALHAWDLALSVRFPDSDTASAALKDPVYAAFDRYLASAAEVVKAWSFVVQEE